MDARAKISDVKSAAWPATFSQARQQNMCSSCLHGHIALTAAPLLQYLADLECPLERSACHEEALEWLLRHAVSLEYADSFCAGSEQRTAEMCAEAAELAQLEALFDVAHKMLADALADAAHQIPQASLGRTCADVQVSWCWPCV